MYKVIRLLSCMIFLAFFSASAQTENDITEKALNDKLDKFRKLYADAAARKQYNAALDEMVNHELRQAKEWVKQKMQEQQVLVKNYRPGYVHKAGDMNLFPMWEEMPGPVPFLPEAKLTSNNLKYEAYIEKVNAAKQQFSKIVQEHLNAMQTDQQSMMNDAKAAANNNAVVQQMGGADAVMNMTEAERKQAAQNASVQIKNNPALAVGSTNIGINAMMKRMMNDPAYREAYNKMTDAQKQEELKKYMGEQLVEQNNEPLKNRDNIYEAANIDNIMGKCLQQMQAATIPYAEGIEMTNSLFNGVYNDIGKWYKQQYDALPLSAQREKIGLAELNKCRETITYAFQEKEAMIRTLLWGLLKTALKIAFGEFNDLIGTYPWGKTKDASLLSYSNTEPRVAKAVVSLYDEMIRLTREAEMLTNDHKGKQEQFELIMK